MKFLLYSLLIAMTPAASADTFILKDGVRLEGEVTGEMDGAVLVKTKYGSLTINKNDIAEQKPSVQPAPQAQPAPAAAVQVSTPAAPAEVLASTEAPAELPAPAEEPAPRLTFATIIPSTSSRLLVYYENGVAIATETFDAAGALALTEGTIKDGTYTEYYGNGWLKTVKSVLGGRTSGTLKAFYPNGKLQIEAYYLGGAKDGPFKYYGEDGLLLLEAEYRGDKLNGWKKEFDAAGAVKSQAYYDNDQLAEPPKPAAAAAEAPKEPESMVTGKAITLARGERFAFTLNGKHIGKVNLDKDYNILGQDGKVPDGTVRVYSAEGKLQKEFVFKKNVITTLRVYEEGGPLEAEYTYKDDKAFKK